MSTILQESSDPAVRSPRRAVSLPPCHPVTRSSARRLLETTSLFIIALLLFRAIGAEPYGVPTGSMAPALMGNHKTVTCPRCGYEVRVGHHEHGASAHSDPPAACPNCGYHDQELRRELEQAPVCRGDHLLVNKTVFTWRKPRRWEMAVFRCPSPSAEGKAFVKRIVALPGEVVRIHDGDVYIDGELARKSLNEFKALCIPVFDHNYQPSQGWGSRWTASPLPDSQILEGKDLHLNARQETADWQWLVYQHRNLDDGKVDAVRDEYSYNGSDADRPGEPVHDFMLECDARVIGGQGTAAFGVTDGAELIVAEIPVGANQAEARIRSEPLGRGHPAPDRTAPRPHWNAGETHHVELAFVDRRATLAVDGNIVFEPVDLPAVEHELPVKQPIRVGARGVEVVISNIRILRDVHYTDAGRHAVRSPVHLGAGEYFVLGDNSPNSDDNRFWTSEDDRPLPVPEANFIGKPFLVHLPSRMAAVEGWGRRWQYHAIDWTRIRWLR